MSSLSVSKRRDGSRSTSRTTAWRRRSSRHFGFFAAASFFLSSSGGDLCTCFLCKCSSYPESRSALHAHESIAAFGPPFRKRRRVESPDSGCFSPPPALGVFWRRPDQCVGWRRSYRWPVRQHHCYPAALATLLVPELFLASATTRRRPSRRRNVRACARRTSCSRLATSLATCTSAR